MLKIIRKKLCKFLINLLGGKDFIIIGIILEKYRLSTLPKNEWLMCSTKVKIDEKGKTTISNVCIEILHNEGLNLKGD